MTTLAQIAAQLAALNTQVQQAMQAQGGSPSGFPVGAPVPQPQAIQPPLQQPASADSWAAVSANLNNQLAVAVSQIKQSSFLASVAATAPTVVAGDAAFDATPVAAGVPVTWGDIRKSALDGQDVQRAMAYHNAVLARQAAQQQANVDNSWPAGSAARGNGQPVTVNPQPMSGGRNRSQPAGTPAAVSLDAQMAAAMNGSVDAEKNVMQMLNSAIGMGGAVQPTAH